MTVKQAMKKENNIPKKYYYHCLGIYIPMAIAEAKIQTTHYIYKLFERDRTEHEVKIQGKRIHCSSETSAPYLRASSSKSCCCKSWRSFLRPEDSLFASCSSALAWVSSWDRASSSCSALLRDSSFFKSWILEDHLWHYRWPVIQINLFIETCLFY